MPSKIYVKGVITLLNILIAIRPSESSQQFTLEELMSSWIGVIVSEDSEVLAHNDSKVI